MGVVAPSSEIKARLSSRSHWLRFLGALLAGHIYGFFFFGVLFVLSIALIAIWQTVYRLQLPALDDVLSILGAAVVLPISFIVLSIYAFPAFAIVAAPILMISAMLLNARFWPTIILGALVGLLLGWLFHLAVGSSAKPPVLLMPSAGMGAGYALALWQICLSKRQERGLSRIG